MWKLILTSFISGTSLALDLDRVSVDAWSIKDNRSPYDKFLRDEPWTQGYGLNLDVSLFKLGDVKGYWNNRIYMNSTERQIRQAGLIWDAGLSWKRLDVYYYHNSDHGLDIASGPYMLENYYGVRYNFIDKRK